MDQAALDAVARQHGLALVIRFGSTVTGQTHAGSDVDLAVMYDRLPSRADAELALIADLQALDGGRAVDLVVLNRADPLLLHQVATHAVLEYGTPQRFDAFLRYAFKRYQDHRPYFELERAYVQRAFSTHAS